MQFTTTVQIISHETQGGGTHNYHCGLKGSERTVRNAKETSTFIMGESVPLAYRKLARDSGDDSTQGQTAPDKSCLPRGSGKLTMTWKGARSVSQLSADIKLQAFSCPEAQRAVCRCLCC